MPLRKNTGFILVPHFSPVLPSNSLEVEILVARYLSNSSLVWFVDQYDIFGFLCH